MYSYDLQSLRIINFGYPNINSHGSEEENNKSGECNLSSGECREKLTPTPKLNSVVERENRIREGALVYKLGEDRFSRTLASWSNPEMTSATDTFHYPHNTQYHTIVVMDIYGMPMATIHFSILNQSTILFFS